MITTDLRSIAELVAPYTLANDARSDVTTARGERVMRRWQRDRAALHARTRWNPDQLDAWQLDRIRAVVDHAYATHPFYYRTYRDAGYTSGDLVEWDDYHALPTVTKGDILDNLDEFLWNRALPSTDVFRSHTSGSTGQVLQILQDNATSDAGQMFYLRHYEQMLGRERRLDEWLYEIYLIPQRYPGLAGSHPVFTLSQDCPTEIAAAHIAERRPTVLWAFPSYLLRLADTVEDLTRYGVEAVCVHSESSTEEERRLLAQRFGTTVHDEYSSEELYLIATQCRVGRYHVVQDNVRVDVMDPDPDGRGEIVATSLVNSYMPFIRYRQGDVIRFDDQRSDCTCGNRFVVLDGFDGRADQDLTRPDGSVVPSHQVMGLYDRTLLAHDAGIAEFRIVQAEDGGVSVLLRFGIDVDEGVALGHIANFETGLARLMALPADALRSRIVKQLPEVSSHKRRLISSEQSGPFDPDEIASRPRN